MHYTAHAVLAGFPMTKLLWIISICTNFKAHKSLEFHLQNTM